MDTQPQEQATVKLYKNLRLCYPNYTQSDTIRLLYIPVPVAALIAAPNSVCQPIP